MNALTYGVREEIYELQGERRISYGIVVYDSQNTYTVLESMADITTDRERLLSLVEKCNTLKLSPIHLKDIVEDFILE